MALFFESKTYAVIAAELGVSVGTVHNRLKEARRMYPDAPWAERKTPRADRESRPVYSRMNDGVTGVRRVPQGSIVQGRRP